MDDNIKISDKDKLQHYLEQMCDCGLFTKDEMNHYEDLYEAHRDYNNTRVYFIP